ncbi:MAG: acyltransferase family protein [Polyangiales bacterium]
MRLGMGAFGTFRANRWFGSLDGLRCISVLGVIFHHALQEHFVGTPLFEAGKHGVSLFFGISGFLITTLLLRERERHGTISLKSFYVRRTLRIFPLYYTIILAYIGLVLIVEPGSEDATEFFQNLPYYLTYTSNWFVDCPPGERVIFFFAWSLAAEEQFYLIWPAVEKKLPRFAPWIVLAVVVGVQVARSGLTPLDPDTLAYSIVTSFAPPIGLGVLLAHLLHSERSFGWVYAWLGDRISSPAALIAVIVALALEVPEYVLFPILVLFIGTCVIREDHGLARVLKLKPLMAAGVVSYGMYLLHMIAMNVVRRVLGTNVESTPFIYFGLASLCAFAGAWISFNYYEKHFLRFKKRFER